MLQSIVLIILVEYLQEILRTTNEYSNLYELFNFTSQTIIIENE